MYRIHDNDDGEKNCDNDEDDADFGDESAYIVMIVILKM